jgi:hypothetical protein
MKYVKALNWEYVVPLLISMTLLLSCMIISPKKYFWNDELYSYYFLADQSFNHMLVAFNDKINNTPILYFALGWVWARFFGAGELSLRLFSSVGICIACVVTWITLRRTYSFLPTALGLLTVVCTSSLILDQNAEARMYGLFLAVCALGLLQFDTLNRSNVESRLNLIVNICIHAAMVNTHLFGIFYSGAIFLTQVVWDAYRQVFRTRVYLSIMLGGLSLIFYIPTFLIQADAGKPRTWIPSPTLTDLTRLMDLSSPTFFQARVLGWILLMAGVLFLINSYHSKTPQVDERSVQDRAADSKTLEIPLILVAFSYLIVPVFVWFVSRAVKPIFIERYLIPSCLGWMIIIASSSSLLLRRAQFHKFLPPLQSKDITNVLQCVGHSIVSAVLIAYLLQQPIQFAKKYSKQERPDAYAYEYGYSNLPIVVSFGGRFVPKFHYSSERQRYFFVLDWEAALDKHSGLFPPQEYKHLDALKRIYPDRFNDNIIQSENFLQKYDRFLVLDQSDYLRKCALDVKGLDKVAAWEDLQCPQWLEMRILANSAYQVKTLIKRDWETVLLVEKIKS